VLTIPVTGKPHKLSNVMKQTKSAFFLECKPGDTWVDPTRFSSATAQRGFRGHFDGGYHSFMDGRVEHIKISHVLYDYTSSEQASWFWFPTN
jgi:hypothetical protein